MVHYFKVLGIMPGVSWEEVKRAYRTQVKKWHPDRFPGAEPETQLKAHRKFQQISEAFQKIEEVYGNQKKERLAEDQSNPQFRRPATNPGQSPFETTEESIPPEPASNVESQDAPGFFYQEWINGDRYEGQIWNGQMHGMGIFTYANGDRYVGQFRYGKPNGQGKLTLANGDSYFGEFRDDRMCGRGTYTYSNGDRFIGYFKDDLPHGEGAHILSSGKVYAGLWENGCLLA